MLPALRRPALVIVDMQAGFVAPGGAYGRLGRSVAEMTRIIPVIERLRTGFRSRGLPRFFTAYRYRPDGSDYPGRLHDVVPRAYAGRTEPFFTEGSPDMGIVADLAPAPDEPILYKNRYSAFFGTDLAGRLDRAGVRTLVVTGVLSHVCVEATARDAFSQDYDVVVVRDAVAGTDPELNQAALHGIEETVGAVASADDVLRSLPTGGP